MDLPDASSSFIKDMEAELASNEHMVSLLEALAALRKKHPTDAQLSSHLIEMSGGDWRKAFNALTDMRNSVHLHLRVLALAVALEGKEREQQPTNKE